MSLFKNKFMEIRAAAGKPTVGEVFIYSYIAAMELWGDEVTPQTIQDALGALGNVSQLHIYINSPGGDVFAGHTIYNIFNRHPAEKIVHVDGVAASIATCIAMVGKKIIMPKNTFMMIHHAWRGSVGNAAKLRKDADDLERINESVIAMYLDRTGMEREELIPMLDAETWLSAEECVKLGLADEVEGAVTVAASLIGDTLAINGAEFDLSEYRNRPKVEALSVAPLPTSEPPAPIQGAGRVLSAENEGHIRSAHVAAKNAADALGKVLDKLGTSEEEPAEEEPENSGGETPTAEVIAPPETDTRSEAVAHLQTLKAQIQTKRRR